MKNPFIVFLTILLCITVFQIGYAENLSTMIEQRTEDTTLSVSVQSILSKELTVDGAVQIA